MADATDLKSVGLNRPCRFESGHRQLKELGNRIGKVIMKLSFNLFRRVFGRAAASLFLVAVSLVLFASSLLAAQEPGPEADGVYSCGKTVDSKYKELGMLELKGKTYRTWSAGDSKEKADFNSFTTDGKGRIEWSVAFHFLDSDSHMGGRSEYSVDAKKAPSILINYSEKHETAFMICTKEK
jgi:hypothetical protein